MSEVYRSEPSVDADWFSREDGGIPFSHWHTAVSIALALLEGTGQKRRVSRDEGAWVIAHAG